jgi:hypothetical protein
MNDASPARSTDTLDIPITRPVKQGVEELLHEARLAGVAIYLWNGKIRVACRLHPLHPLVRRLLRHAWEIGEIIRGNRDSRTMGPEATDGRRTQGLD